jgi:hypothetical protein
MSKNVIIFKSNINVQNPNMTFESELEDNSKEINDFTNSYNNDEDCSNIPNISFLLPNDPKNIDLNDFDIITSSNNFNDVA